MADNDELRERVKLAMATLDVDATGLARILGRGKDYVRDFLEGRKRSIDAISLQMIDREVRERSGSGAVPSAVGFRPPPDFFGDRDLPVYSAAEGGPGEMVVSTEAIEWVPRPWFMKEVKEGFAILIVGESMEPAYEPGDMAIVNPRLTPLRNKDAIFTTGEHGGVAGGEFKATIKRLVRSDAKSWHVRQFNEPREFVLERKDWPKALRVVGKLSGG